MFCSLSGFGQTGPYRDLATHGVAYDAFAGHAQPETTDHGFTTIPARYQDIGTQAGALHATVAVLAAVLHARATGTGAYLDVAQADAAVVWNAGRLDPLLSDAAVASGANDLRESVRYQYYTTADDRTILFQASERHFFERFCDAVGRHDLLGAPGAEVGEHARGDHDLRRELAAIFATRTQAEWVQLFIDADVPGGPVHTADEPAHGSAVPCAYQLIEQDHPDAGHLRLIDNPVHTTVPREPAAPAPRQGEHTEEVLREVLGYDERRIAMLRVRNDRQLISKPSNVPAARHSASSSR